MAKASKSKTKSRPKATAKPGAGRGARTPGTSKSRPGPKVPTLAEFFAAATGHALESAVVVGDTVYWLPAGAGAPDTVVEVTPRGTTTLLGAAVEGVEAPRQAHRAGAPYPEASGITDFVARRVRTPSIPSGVPRHQEANAALVAATEELLALYAKLEALYAEHWPPAADPGRDPDVSTQLLVDSAASGRSRRIMAARDPERMKRAARIAEVEARVEELVTWLPSEEYLHDLGHTDLSVLPEAMVRRVQRAQDELHGSGRRGAPRLMPVERRDKEPLRAPMPASVEMRFNILVNAIADVLESSGDSRKKPPDAQFILGAKALARCTDRIPAARRRISTALRDDLIAPEGRAVLEALQGVLGTLMRDPRVRGARMRHRPHVHRDGTWSVPRRVHDLLRGSASEFGIDLPKRQRIVALVSAFHADPEPRIVAAYGCIGAITAKMRRAGYRPESADRYLVDSAKYLPTPKKDNESAYLAELSARALRRWTDACGRAPGD